MKKSTLLVWLFFISTAIYSLAIPKAQATDPSATRYGLDTTASSVAPFKDQTRQDYTTYISDKTGQIIGVVLSFVGVIFFGLMIYAGIMWMTSGGNEQTVTKAKDLIINAIIGIIIVLAAYAITSFLGTEVIN